MEKLDLSYLKANWPSAIVARAQIGKFTGGLIAPGTVANLDALGQGPEGAFRIGRKIAYPVDALITWLESRISLTPVKRVPRC